MICPLCSQELDSEGGFKRHMTTKHGGYTTDQLKKAGIKPTQRDIARALAGNTSAAEVTSQAPDSEPTPGSPQNASQPRTRRPRQSQVDPEVEKAKEQILRLRCSRIATLPYTLLANLLGEPAIKLSEEEASMLTESYVTLAKAYGWEGASKLLLWGDVAICQAAIVAAPERKEAIFKAVGMVGQPEQVQEEVQQAEEATIQ